jgi:hypothetical protein
VVYSIKTGIKEKSYMLNKLKDMFTNGDIQLPVGTDDALDYLNKQYNYYKLDNTDNLRARLLMSYVQTNIFVNEAINLERVIVQGYISAKEKSGRRKDRVMSLVYGLSLANELESDLGEDNDFDLADFVISC